MNTWEIIPNLWQANLPGALGAQADLMVTCSHLGEITVLSDLLKGVRCHILWPFLDVPRLPDGMEQLRRVAFFAAVEHKHGSKVVVHCNEGLDRSGLVLGLILYAEGVKDVLGIIQKAHPEALTKNRLFADYVKSLG
jgi:hypothetical protein